MKPKTRSENRIKKLWELAAESGLVGAHLHSRKSGCSEGSQRAFHTFAFAISHVSPSDPGREV
jgi:predicted TIM-barrel fold metal-dependent hydrolase